MFGSFIIAKAVLLPVAFATFTFGSLSVQPTSVRHKVDNGDGRYSFAYKIDDDRGSNFRRETGHGHGRVTGSYGIREADGRMRTVHYVADEHGFRTRISTNEPGTNGQDSADAVVNEPDRPDHVGVNHPGEAHGADKAHGSSRIVKSSSYKATAYVTPPNDYVKSDGRILVKSGSGRKPHYPAGGPRHTSHHVVNGYGDNHANY
ncbi:CPR50 (predicted) [Pycnogonum litorale]